MGKRYNVGGLSYETSAAATDVLIVPQAMGADWGRGGGGLGGEGGGGGVATLPTHVDN